MKIKIPNKAILCNKMSQVNFFIKEIDNLDYSQGALESIRKYISLYGEICINLLIEFTYSGMIIRNKPLLAYASAEFYKLVKKIEIITFKEFLMDNIEIFNNEMLYIIIPDNNNYLTIKKFLYKNKPEHKLLLEYSFFSLFKEEVEEELKRLKQK
ncbi:MAG: hypothetical protein M0P71_00975 [Melioribacteraceae bacterium]|nr:hypothetical protein [Melioribacteraceae bacterium]